MVNNMTVDVTDDKIELRIFGGIDEDIRDYRPYMLTPEQANALQLAIEKAVGFIRRDNFPIINIKGVPDVSQRY